MSTTSLGTTSSAPGGRVREYEFPSPRRAGRWLARLPSRRRWAVPSHAIVTAGASRAKPNAGSGVSHRDDPVLFVTLRMPVMSVASERLAAPKGAAGPVGNHVAAHCDRR